MKDLKTLINEELHNLVEDLHLDREFLDITNFITVDQKSAEFIRFILNDGTFTHPEEGTEMYELAQDRSRHSALTFLIGLVFKKAFGLYDSFAEVFEFGEPKIDFRLWLLVSLYHDKGYYSTRLKKKTEVHKQDFKYDLFSDKPISYEVEHDLRMDYKRVLAFSYDELRQYDVWALQFHSEKGDKECVDHGILGGYIVYNDYLAKIKRYDCSFDENDYLINKITALTISQHNLFKTQKDDKEFDWQHPGKPKKLTCGDPFRIAKETPLLLFLALIDTFECVKKLSKGENPSKYLETPTVLKCIELSIESDKVIIDYTKLKKAVYDKKDNDLKKVFDSYLKSICRFNEWTFFKVLNQEENRITIMLDSSVVLQSVVE